ncbi:MAG: hypothetical protein GY940_45140, partial [bacterium]|nr:hypothetical protein [bacterium]
LRHSAYKKPHQLKEMVYHYREGVLFQEYREVKSHLFQLADGKTREIDVYALSYHQLADSDTDLAFEVKNRQSKKTGVEDVNLFIRKLEDLRQSGRPVEGIFYSANGFTEDALRRMKECGLMYTDLDRWWGTATTRISHGDEQKDF